MEGGTEVEKRLNSLITVGLVLSGGVPADECVSEARHLLRLWEEDKARFRKKAAAYLLKQFNLGADYEARFPLKYDRLQNNTQGLAAEAEEIIRGQ